MPFPICIDTALETTRSCTETTEQSHETCERWEDQGYDRCDAWDAQCCTWWPCSWACAVVTAVCVAFTWVVRLVCTVTVFVVNVICLAWTVVTTLVCLAWGVAQLVLTPVALIWELIASIPFVGRVLDMALNLVQTAYWRVMGGTGIALDLVGIRPLKKLDLCIIILRDDTAPVTTPAALAGPIADATRILRDEADIVLNVTHVHTETEPSPEFALNVGCNLTAVGEDLSLTGSWFSLTAARVAPLGAASRLLGYRKQMIAFCVADIPGRTAGCALGPLNDYLTLEGANPVCLTHEIGHKLGLWHCCAGTNVVNENTCRGTQMTWWQVLIARNAKYVGYV